jgi:hypothetical protein
LNLADVEDICYAAKNQKRAVQVALYRRGDAIAKNVFPLRKRLFCVLAGGMIKLAQARVPGRNRD